MFIVRLLKNIWQSLPLFQKNAKILFLGLENAGKTTLLQRLKENKISIHDPTIHPHAEELIIGNVRFKAFDMGGHKAVRKIWKNYYSQVSGIVYLIDSSDEKKFDESKYELQQILNAEELKNVPILILGNKIDQVIGISELTIQQALGIEKYHDFNLKTNNDINDRKLKLFMCSIANQIGYSEGFKWLSEQIH